jgi:predicted tellurium resistance membrane protein TerC
MIDLLIGLLTLTVLEVILGIDNLIFLSVLTSRLPPQERQKARFWGLMLAWVSRILLLIAAMGLIHLTTPWFIVDGWPVSCRAVFFLLGGSFLIIKATQEIHREVEHDALRMQVSRQRERPSLMYTVVQIMLMDIVFSLDSVLTAVGLTSSFTVMTMAITVAIGVMLYMSGPVSEFINTHPTVKMLAFSFLLLIGMVLIADALMFHIPRGYVYCAMGFSLAVESLNLIKKVRKRRYKRGR